MFQGFEDTVFVYTGRYIVGSSFYFFMVVSAIMITFVGGWVTEKVVEPRLGKYNGGAEALKVEGISVLEKKGLRYAGWATLIFIALMAWTIIPEEWQNEYADFCRERGLSVGDESAEKFVDYKGEELEKALADGNA